MSDERIQWRAFGRLEAQSLLGMVDVPSMDVNAQTAFWEFWRDMALKHLSAPKDEIVDIQKGGA